MTDPIGRVIAVPIEEELRSAYLDYERLETLGVRFSLQEMGRLAALAQHVVADERRRRVAETSRTTSGPLTFGVAGASR